MDSSECRLVDGDMQAIHTTSHLRLFLQMGNPLTEQYGQLHHHIHPSLWVHVLLQPTKQALAHSLQPLKKTTRASRIPCKSDDPQNRMQPPLPSSRSRSLASVPAASR